ncbi:RluA family pseudouridine synthase [Metabacillus indicus]|uniref:RluA family pseudouridine synthase n=1 Tax=Metabacillus indicus TaxID=246786 RepID=UPI000492EE33|nr:RluA family pseudouridine synthase [Metabacillus indicus]KEZ49831.1 pseudouridine synthase [Metabacillus indicus LMG 22858]
MKRKGEWLILPVKKEWAGLSLQQMVKEKLHVPKGLAHSFRINKDVKVNEKDPDWTQPLKESDSVMIRVYQEEDCGTAAEYMELDFLYEDDHFLIVNKPAGMDTHPNEPSQTGTLANGIASHFQMNGLSRKIRHIHRLDRDTSGAVVFAKHALSHAVLDRLLEERKVKRTYTAVVQGEVKQKKGRIDHPIGKDRHHPSRRRVSPGGQPAITHFKREGYTRKFDVSLLKLQLDTGRTHQIRVHVSHIGFPITGDVLYGGNQNLIRRQALHASEISVVHPFTGEEIEVSAPFPEDMRDLLVRLEFL